MSSISSSSNLSSQITSSPDNKTHGAKRRITRVKTGCATCRKRRKKCDEGRPICGNCHRANFVCEGYQRVRHWDSLRTPKRSEKAVEAPSHNHSHNSHLLLEDGALEVREGAEQDDFQRSSSHPVLHGDCDHDYQSTSHYQLATPSSQSQYLNPISTQAKISSGKELLLYERPLYSPNLALTGLNSLNAADCEVQSSLPAEIPLLIPGLESQLHQNLFCHFTGVMSHLLTTFATEANPFNSVVIPLALDDKTVMDTLLCLASSHVLKLQNNLPDLKLKEERERLHNRAIQSQTQRIKDLVASSTPEPTLSPQHLHKDTINTLFATSILLCLIEICEGTGDNAWRTHLNMARQVITLATPSNISPDPTPQDIAGPKCLTNEIHPFLLEFFLYHDSLATVTVPSTTTLEPYFRSLSKLSEPNASLVGLHDGLLDFITRISTLHSQTHASPKSSKIDGKVICAASKIWQDLSNWKPNPTFSPKRNLVAQFYQWASYIWLFSIINPSKKSDLKIQSAVSKMLVGMKEIKDGDGLMSCLLFPLFIVGMAAIRKEDRDDVKEMFRRLGEWSKLGNIGLTWKVVERIWEREDEGAEGSWDWVGMLEHDGISFLVT